MANEVEVAVDAEVVTPVNKMDESLKPQGGYIGGEIRISADPRNGAISVNAPQNIIIALGLLEVAKSILIQKQQEAIKKVQDAQLTPGILRATPQDINKLSRPS